MKSEEANEFLEKLERLRQQEINDSYNRSLETNKTISMWRLIQPLHKCINYTTGVSMFTFNDCKHFMLYDYVKKEFELWNDTKFVSDLPVNISTLYFLKGYLIGKDLYA